MRIFEKKIFFFLIQVHHEMAKYHEVGRFVLGDSKDEKLIDWESAIFHEEHAAELGELEAMVTMAKLYLGQDREVLVNCVVEVRRSEYRDIGTLNNVYESNYSISNQCEH